MSTCCNITVPSKVWNLEEYLLYTYFWWDVSYGSVAGPAMQLVYACITGIFLCFGGLFNILTIITNIRRRPWREHGGYIHLLAVLISVTATIAVTELPVWIARVTTVPSQLARTGKFANTSEVACKAWSFISRFHHFTSLFVVALLLNVYLRRHVTSSRRYVKAFAGKYCTIRGSLVVICFIASVSLIVNLGRTRYYNVHKVADLFLFGLHLSTVNTSDIKICVPSEKDLVFRFGWELAEMTLASYLPVAIFLPLLLFMIRCTGTRFGQPNTKDFTLTATYIAISLFISMMPKSVTNFRYHIRLLSFGGARIRRPFNLSSFLEIILLLLSLSYFVVIPVVCLTTLYRMRDELKSFVRGKCPSRPASSSNVNADVEVDANATSSSDVTEIPSFLNT